MVRSEKHIKFEIDAIARKEKVDHNFLKGFQELHSWGEKSPNQLKISNFSRNIIRSMSVWDILSETDVEHNVLCYVRNWKIPSKSL